MDLYVDYLTHIGMVAMEVIWAIQNSTEKYNANLAVQCAVLHDIIEDTEVKYEELSAEFGKEVADGVLALSKNEQLETKELQMKDSLDRIKGQPHEVWMVKMADRISNLYATPFYWEKEKIGRYRDEAVLIYNSLAGSNLILAQRLKTKIEEYAVKFLKCP